MIARLSRRRFLAVTAAAAGLPLIPFTWPAGAEGAETLRRWHGTALGADARIVLLYPDAEAAERLIRSCVAEITRLERLFSLQRNDSAIVCLNRDGGLDRPPSEFVRLLEESHRFSERTDGAFDATVQPLWRLYARHFAKANADPAGPDARALARARELVDYSAVGIDTRRITFRKPRMAVTLNGIAQGYITDRVTELLRDSGAEKVLVNLGEFRALGGHPDGRPWRIGLRDPHNPLAVFRTLEIENQAVATSGGYGTPFEPSGRHHHLFDPVTGRSANYYLAVTVLARRATVADALSTALAVTPSEGIQGRLDAVGSVRAIITMADGSVSVRAARSWGSSGSREAGMAGRAAQRRFLSQL